MAILVTVADFDYQYHSDRSCGHVFLLIELLNLKLIVAKMDHALLNVKN